jgi:hypothetical protein
VVVYDAELWANGLALRESVSRRDRLQTLRVMTVAFFCDSHAAIRRTEHLEHGPGQLLARCINQNVSTLREAGSKQKFAESWDALASPGMRKQIAK